MSEIEEQFKKHEVEDQRRFDETNRDMKQLFVKVSDLIGDTNERHKENKEVSKQFVEDIKEAKKDISTLKTDVREVRTDIKWIRENMEKEAREDKESKNGMVSMDRFKPVEMIVYGVVGFIGLALLGFLIPKLIQLINGYFH